MTNLRIGVGLNFYQDFDSLRRMLFSLQCCAFDVLIAVDGKYNEWPNKDDPDISDEATRDLLHSTQTPVMYIAAPNKTQNEKRQIYMDEAGALGLDAIVILDTDDYIVCEKTNYALFKEDLERKVAINKTYRQAYCIPCQMWDQWPHPNLDGQIQNIARVFYRPETLRYTENHFTLRHKTTGVCQVFTGAVVCEHIQMAHDHKLRDKTYQQVSTTYSKALLQWEKEGRYR